jgi:hypothetical protein
MKQTREKKTMKKLMIMIAILMGFSATAQADVNFQKVYDHPGKAQDLIDRIQRATVLDWKVQNHTLKGTAKVKCLIKKKGIFPAVYSTYRGDIVFEAKDNRFRVTYANMKYVAESEIDKSMGGMRLSSAHKIDCSDDFDKLTWYVIEKAEKYDNNW